MSRFTHAPVAEKCSFGPWTITSTKNHILCSEGERRTQFEDEVGLPSYPEMIFDQNTLRIEVAEGCGLFFNAEDALKLVDKEKDSIKVAGSTQWKEARSECEHIQNVIKPHDWTFTTNYKGTLIDKKDCIQIESTEEKIDMDKLKGHEKILFYADVLLFEDELHDHGCSIMNVKIRVMPTYYFVLLRLYMRVDGVLIRNNDTRLYHEAGTNYIIREFTSRETKFQDLTVPVSLYSDPNEAWKHLKLTSEQTDKIVLPESYFS